MNNSLPEWARELVSNDVEWTSDSYQGNSWIEVSIKGYDITVYSDGEIEIGPTATNSHQTFPSEAVGLAEAFIRGLRP